MTTFNQFHDRNRDIQDGIERHKYFDQKVTDKGSFAHVKGTDTEDEEVPIMNSGVGFRLPQDANTEVMLVAMSSDTAQKMAILTIPRDKNRDWKENTNGIQSIQSAARALEFNAKRTYVDDTKFATRGGVLEVDGDTVYIRGDLVVQGDLRVGGSLYVQGAIIGPLPSGSATVNVPGFEE